MGYQTKVYRKQGGDELHVASEGIIIFEDDGLLHLGTDADIVGTFDGTNFSLKPATDDTGAIHIGDGTTDMDVKIFLGSTSEYVLFDVGNSALTLAGIPFNLTGALTIGSSGEGHDVIFHGETAGNYLHWDESEDDLLLVGTATQFAVAGTTDASSSTTGSMRTAGGLGVALKAYIGGVLTVSDSTEASAVGTASAIFDGGVSIAKKLYVGSDINVANAAIDLIVKANQDSALEFYDGTTNFIDIDTRNTVTGVSNITLTAMPSTIVAASGVTKNLLSLVPGTTTLTGSTGVTALNGLALTVAQPTVTDEDAVTVTTASTVYIANAPAGGGSATLTNAYALDVADGGVHIGGGTYGIYMDGTHTNAIRITNTVDTTAHTGIRLLNTYTGADGYHVGVMGASIWNPTAATGYGAVIGVYGEANIQGEFTGGTNWSFGVRGTLQLTDDTVINDGSSIFGAINASLKDDPTPTLTAGHICGIYIENLIDADLSGITGITAMIYAANNASATCTMDYGMYLYGPKVTNLLGLYDCTVAGCVGSNDSGGSTLDFSDWVKIAIDIDGTTHYLVAAQTVANS